MFIIAPMYLIHKIFPCELADKYSWRSLYHRYNFHHFDKDLTSMRLWKQKRLFIWERERGKETDKQTERQTDNQNIKYLFTISIRKTKSNVLCKGPLRKKFKIKILLILRFS